MTARPHLDRRAVLRGGLAASAAGALGLGTAGAASAVAPHTAARTRSAARTKAAPQPRIYTTAEWGARPPSSDIVILDHVPTYVVVHHTVNPGNSNDYSLKHAKKICRDIQNLHMDTNGWADTGQQFTISRGGYALEGRHQSLDVVRGGTQHVQGANVANHNSEVIGIENEGLYTNVDVPDALWDSLVDLVAWIVAQYKRPVKNIMGHRDFNSTECPGDVLYGRLPELRDEVAGRLGVSNGPGPVVWPLLRPGDTGPRVRAAQHLLRARGFNSLRADGVFGAATKTAVAKIAELHGIRPHTCSALRHRVVDETGYLGSDIWPLLTPRLSAGQNGEVAKAVTTLRGAGSEAATAAIRPGAPLSTLNWQHLLS
ncbi:peptidoglycan recognition protein family protein [Streptomyces sp. KR80]|uniref:peptidoglycan recognition protein family protein n=1 Tax=Streptomyces sp. KR80 TaxID=3457426 RepID=UPI003FD3E681